MLNHSAKNTPVRGFDHIPVVLCGRGALYFTVLFLTTDPPGQEATGTEGIYMSPQDTDEFAAYDFSEFTEEDFVQIDAEVAKKCLPKLPIAYETSSNEPSNEAPSSPAVLQAEPPKTEWSPLHRYRPRGTLSVTDLVSPSWCEVQFEYGLQGMRSRPLHTRPKSFKSASGKEIKVNKNVAAQNNIVTGKGRAIHKFLERQVKEEVTVAITSPEERWGLRLVNMLSCLDGIRFGGFTREMPVFGIEDGRVVNGIIDELIYQPLCFETSADHQETKLSQTQVGGSFPTARSQNDVDGICVKPGVSSPHMLQLIDTKTRRKFSLPLLEDMLPAQLQLMLYHRLLSRLVSPEYSFDFLSFWKMTGVDPTRRFTTNFLVQSGLLHRYSELQVYDLAGLSALWQDQVHQLSIVGVDDRLKLVYRLQSPNKNESAFKRRRISTSEEAALSGAMGAGFLGDQRVKSADDVTTKDRGSTSTSKLNTDSAQNRDTVFPTVEDELNNNCHKSAQDGKGYQIIGTKIFQHDPDLLSAYLVDILEWWRGERKPRGVPVELSHRCHTCEYSNDCEWREKRAVEFREQAELEREA